MNAIVIATTKGREEWVKGCLESLDNYYGAPVIVLDEYEYELGKIRWIYEHTDIDQFLFLQDSVVIKEYRWIDDIFAHDRPVSLSHKPFFMYLGKYTRKTLDKVKLPTVSDKWQSVYYEDEWTAKYDEVANPIYLWPLHDNQSFEMHNGRKNMILENDHLKKYKGTWHPDMIKDE